MKKLYVILFGSFWLSAAWAEQLADKLKPLGITNTEIQSSPIAGIKMVISDQGVFYISDDGQYLLDGNLLKIKKNGDVESVKETVLLKRLNQLEDDMIIYPAVNAKHTITVFMDISCYYCKKLFENIKAYNQQGITVRLLAYPRNGLDSVTAQQMEAIWQSKDPMLAMEQAELGHPPQKLLKPEKIIQHYTLGLWYGIRGTPAIVTDKGQLLRGYMAPERLLTTLQQD